MGENHLAAAPSAVYGGVLLMAGLAYVVLQRAILRLEENRALLGRAVGRDLKGKASLGLYAIGIGLAFVSPWVSSAVYLFVALMWLVPDRRIERVMGAGAG
jgi:uncharacterized membrane protein